MFLTIVWKPIFSQEQIDPIPQTYDAVNQRRADEFSLPPLERSEALEYLAYSYARVLAEKDTLSHYAIPLYSKQQLMNRAYLVDNSYWLRSYTLSENIGRYPIGTKLVPLMLAYMYDISMPHFITIYRTQSGYMGWGMYANDKYIYICTYVANRR